MEEKLIKPYEISVWEDRLVENGEESNFVETKLAIIGSDKMTGWDKIYNPVFNKKSNGEKTLSFSLKYKYFDPYNEEEVVNPFVKLLTNERKVKLYYDDEWYEFVVKDHTESSEEFSWDYSCVDAFVLELSKTGYNLTFDAELNNNQGTARELIQKTIENTDWRLGDINPGKQLIAEPIYKAVLHNEDRVQIINASGDEQTLVGNNIYVFYSYVKNQNGKFVQFIIHNEARTYIIDDKNVITDTNFRILTDLVYEEREESGQLKKGFWLKNNDAYTLIIEINEIEERYQANRLGYGQLTTYDPVMERTVDRFKIENGDREVYRYTDYTYTTSNVVMNYITNGDNFNVLEDGTLQGWNPYTDSQGEVNKLSLVTKPELGPNIDLVNIDTLFQIEGFLNVKFNGPKVVDTEGKIFNTIYNSGIENNASVIQSIAKGQKFVFRWRGYAGRIEVGQNLGKLRLLVAKYTQDAPTRFGYYYKHINQADVVLEFDGEPQVLNNEITGGILEEAYRKTGDLEIVPNKTYYTYNETEQTYTEVVEPDPEDLPLYYEKYHNYVIDNVPQAPSTSYIYMVNDVPYIWDATVGDFAEQTNSNYQPYYYLVGTATKSISNLDLKDSSKKYGIFLYSVNTEETPPLNYYIQDVQLTRFIPDVSDPTGNTPVLIGNIPTAATYATEYYYIQPSGDITAEEIITYTNLDSLKSELGITDNIVPLYNEDSVKNLSISVSQSNCFDILQTIAETFECWVDLKVVHDSTGAIEYDESGKPKKFVAMREYVGAPNYAGFKYGVNLQSIERNINSDEFVTKLIVDQSQSDYVDEGFVSIGSAQSNISGESYILNFNYYYSQGLLDREIAEKDRLKFISDLKDINRQYQEKEKYRRELETSLTNLGSIRNTYMELVTTAQEKKSEALGDFADANTDDEGKTLSYEEYRKVHGKLPDLEKLTDSDAIIDILSEIYINSAAINNYSGILTNIDKEYWQVRKKLRGSEDYSVKIWSAIDVSNEHHVYVELNDYLPGFEATFGTHTETSTVSKKFFDRVVNKLITEITLVAPENYYFDAEGHPTTITYTIDDSKVSTFKIISANTISGVEDEIKELLDEKESITKAFNNKYSRFIQEGTWSSTDYIDSELYYLDALQVSNTSAQPVVSYTINVVEISQLEGFESYKFDTGDKTYIEDTEFFGHRLINVGTQQEKKYVLTPVQEEVVVSEVEWHLDEPDQNTITVQNYKSRFEDLFQRISATVQTVQFNEVNYAKISTLMNPDGTINPDIFIDSINRLGGRRYALTSDGSVEVNGNEITIQNLTNRTNRVKIDNEGLHVSSDGGETWRRVIDGQGLNIGAVYTGTLNTNEVVIGNKDNPSFRWDKAGLSAYGTKTVVIDGTSTEAADLQTYVRFDQYGIYGIEKGESFKAQTLQDILQKAHFAVTWDGFFIKNKYEGGGRVEITSDNDFRITKTLGGVEQEVIKIGALEWNGSPVRPSDPNIAPTKYGIRIKNDNGDNVFTTDNSGNLKIVGTVSVGDVDSTPPSPHIQIDGANALIQSSNYSNNSGWRIDSDGDAYFNNITARGSIKTAVFEYAEIQAVGGIFMFRPSSRIRSAAIDENNFAYEKTKDTTINPNKTYYIYDDVTEDYVEVASPVIEDIDNYYEQFKSLVVTVDKELLFKDGQWCKVSNYYSGNYSPDVNPQNQTILQNNGLRHIYKVSRTQGSNEIVLLGAAAMVEGEDKVVSDVSELVGGALVDMGNKANGDGKVGTLNYGIGVNSSDNTVNLPARAISLFETIIDETAAQRVRYDYKGILGTIPRDLDINDSIRRSIEGTQGIYTDNMYIGNAEQYVAFYRDKNDNQAKLDIKGNVYIGDSTLNSVVNIENGAISLGDPNGFHIFIDGSNSEKYTYGLGFYESPHKPYQLSTDMQAYADKEYYRYDETTNTYIKVIPQEGDNPKVNGWYEYKDRRIAYINSEKLFIPYSVVLKGMDLGIDENDPNSTLWRWELQEDTKNLTLKWMGGVNNG